MSITSARKQRSFANGISLLQVAEDDGSDEE